MSDSPYFIRLLNPERFLSDSPNSPDSFEFPPYQKSWVSVFPRSDYKWNVINRCGRRICCRTSPHLISTAANLWHLPAWYHTWSSSSVILYRWILSRCVSVCLSACLSLCQFVCLRLVWFVFVFSILLVYPCFCRPGYLSKCLLVYISAFLYASSPIQFVCLSVCMSVCLSTYPASCPPVTQSAYSSTHPSIH